MNNNSIIGISGKIGSGKSTFCEYAKKHFNELAVKCDVKGFADKLKDITEILTGYRGETQEEKNIYLENYELTVGQVLQKLGTDTMRKHFDKDVWIKALFSNINKNAFTLIQDVRFLNEAKAIKCEGGILIRINGDPIKVRENSSRNLTHESEIELDDYDEFDEIYENDATLNDLETFSTYVIHKYFDC